MEKKDFLDALREAYKRAGTQAELAHQANMSQGTVSDYLNNRYDIGNMTVTTLLRLFPDMVIDFFGKKSGDDDADRRRAALLRIFDGLTVDEQLDAIAMMAANFGDKIREMTKK